MDPLSVSASVVGILGAAANVTKILTKLILSAKAAPKSAQNVLMEVTDITACLTQLQSFLLGTTPANRSRTTLIMVEQLVVTLTSCVLVFSELEEMLDSLKTDLPLRSIDRLRWARKENAIARIFVRLQGSKGTLNLLITTLTCASMDEAHGSVKDLSNLVEQVLAENQEMSRRLKTLELQSHNSLSLGASTRHLMDDATSILTTRSQIDDRAKSQNITQTTTYGFAFDQDLNESRVYSRALHRHSNLSLPSTTINSMGWSFFSGISLAEVSNISVISLPISVNELWNHQHYLPKIRHLTTPGGLPSLAEDGLLIATCLLLGSEEAGKSTIQKQFEILYGNGFDDRDRIERRVDILEGLNNPFRRFLHELEKKDSPAIGFSSVLLNHAQEIELNENSPTVYLTALGSFTRYVSRHRYVRLEDKIVYNDNIYYFMTKIERMCMSTYMLTNEDMLRSYVQTAGIYQSNFRSSQIMYQIFDTAGNSAERGKWSLYLTQRTYDVLLYVVAISDYDQSVNDANKLYIDIKRLQSLAENRAFQNTTIIVFLNKVDIFKEKITHVPVSAYFTDFLGGSDYDLACKYFAGAFRETDGRPKQNTHVFFTNATDVSSFQSKTMKDLESVLVKNRGVNAANHQISSSITENPHTPL